MKRILVLMLWLAAAVMVTAAMMGCGGGGGASSIAPDSDLLGVQALGALDTSGTLGVRGGDGPFDLNPYYTNSYLVPQRYSVALTKFELMKSDDDTDPYVVFDTGDINSPEVVDLTNGESAAFGENTEYPDAGTYTHVRMTVVYFESDMMVDSGFGAGVEPGTFRVYASTVGNILNGDIVELRDDKWYWMPGSGTMDQEDLFVVSTDVGPRPDSNSGHDFGIDGATPRSIVVQEFYFSQGDDQSSDPYVVTLELPEPLVIPANPTGLYKITTTFDVGASILDPNATGVFLFDDVDGDGVFEPGPGMGDGSGRDFNDGVHGEPMYSILPPQMQMGFTKVD